MAATQAEHLQERLRDLLADAAEAHGAFRVDDEGGLLTMQRHGDPQRYLVEVKVLPMSDDG